MTMHYCDIFTDCYHCPAPFCPYEKLEPDWLDTPCPVEDGDGLKEEEMQD